jgi:hypothetical protein
MAQGFSKLISDSNLKPNPNPNPNSNPNSNPNPSSKSNFTDQNQFNSIQFDNYIGSNKKIFSYDLNNDLSLPAYKSNCIVKNIDKNDDMDEEDDVVKNTDEKINDINYKFNNLNSIKVEDVDSDEECDDDNDYALIENDCIKIMQNEHQHQPMQILHLNIPYLDENNNWINNSENFYQEYLKTNLDYLREKYMDQRIITKGFDHTNKSNPNQIYRIISETCKSDLEPGLYSSENKYYTSTTLLNQDKIYDGLTNIELYFKSDLNNELSGNVIIENIQIRSRAKNKEIPNSYRNIQWDLEFDLIPGGARILGLDNFIHLSLVGLEEVFLDIIYTNNNSTCPNQFHTEIKQEFFQKEKINLELKYTRCIYNQTIKDNLEKFLYENEECYFTDIIDYLEQYKINLDHEEKIFGNMYATNYNILRIMSGMGGIAYSN